MSRLRPLFPYLALTLFACIAAEPLARAAMTCSDDGSFHLLRAVELGSLIQSGHFFPRWSAHMAHGYGFPFYNFYAPLSSYFVVSLHWLGLAYPLALKLAFGLGLWLAGLATFWFVRQQWGERAGVVAGVAYLFAPYLAYDVLYRANFAESFAFIWPPLILWGLRSTVDRRLSSGFRLPASFFLTSFCYAALILTHNVFALIASPLFVGYVILLAWQNRSVRLLGLGGAALLLGIALSAYFWLPAIVERSWVQSERLLVPPVFTWYTNFISLRELLVLPQLSDPLLINPSPVRGVGLLTVLLGLPGLTLALIQKKKDNALTTILFFALALVGYGVMTLPASTPLWRLMRPLELVQFPWRMLGPAALCAAILVGASVRAIEERLAARPIFLLLPFSFSLIALFVGNLAWWYPRYCPSTMTGSVADLLAFEDATHTIGTTAKGEYLPRTVEYLPADDSLRLALQRGEEPSRLVMITGQAEITSPTPPDPLNASFQVTSTTETTFTYRQFDYPGWTVTVDGRSTAIQVTPGEGLIGFTVPPGLHTVRVVFGLIPLRAAADGVSLLTLVALIGVGSLRARSNPLGPMPQSHPSNFGMREVSLVAALLILKLAFIDRYPNPLRQSVFDGETLTTAPVSFPTNFAGGVRLLGYGLSAKTVRADEALDVTAYAALWESSLRRYWPNFVIEEAQGLRWDNGEAYPPRWHREPPHTPFWPVDQYAQWARHLTLLPGTPPGEYQLWGEVFDLDSQQIASLLDEQGNAIAPRFLLGVLTVARPSQPIALQPEHTTPHIFGPLSLLGYNFSHDAVNAGDAIELTLYWTCSTAPTQDYVAQLAWRDSTGNIVHQIELPPVANYPTSHWQSGDQWRGRHQLIIPAALTSGDYQVSLSISGEAGSQRLGALNVSAPERTFVRPPVEVETGAVFEGVGRLEGYALHRADQQLTLTLIWKATATPAARYNVFVHLADANGRVWTQSDAMPAQWTRPTTGWLVGEYIEDVHSLRWPDDLPLGDYTVWVGLYDPSTNQRVTLTGPGATSDRRVRLTSLSLP